MEKLILSREQLYNLVWSEPFLTLSKKYAMSDVGLRKMCVRMDIPVPKTGYWQRVRAGRKVKKPNLPSGYTGKGMVTLVPRKDNSKELSELEQIQEQIENDSKVNLGVPERLGRSHPLIKAVRKGLLEWKGHYRQTLLTTSASQLRISASKKSLSRALRFMDTLIKAVHARGHTFEVGHDGTFILLHGEKIQVSLKEKTRRVEVPNKYNPSSPNHEFEPTGVLGFQIEDWERFSWKDNSLPIEEQLSKIIARIEFQGKKKMKETIRRNKEHEERERQAQLRRDLEKQKEIELEKFRSLLNTSNRWHQASKLREYLNAIQLAQSQHNEQPLEWMEWAKKKLDWFDPCVNAKDDLLTEKDIEEFKKYNPASTQKPLWS